MTSEGLTDAEFDVPRRDRGPLEPLRELEVRTDDGQVTFSDKPCDGRWLTADEELVVTGEAME